MRPEAGQPEPGAPGSAESGFKSATEIADIASQYPQLDHVHDHAHDVALTANRYLDAGRSTSNLDRPESLQQRSIDVQLASAAALQKVDNDPLYRNGSEGVRHAIAADVLPERVEEHRGITGLQSKDSFLRMVQAAESLGTGDPHSQKIVIADVNSLKRMNDTLGHPAGDALLMKVADEMRAVASELDIDHDRLALIGGDEFGAVLPAAVAAEFVRSVTDRFDAWVTSGEALTYDNNRAIPAGAAQKLRAGLTVTYGDTEREAEAAMPQAKLDAKYGTVRQLQKARQLLDRLRGGR